MPRLVQVLCGVFIAGLVIGAPIVYGYHRHAQFRNFRVVHEGVLYRSGQMTLDGLKRVLHDYGIRTIITLREPGTRPGESTPDTAEEIYCNAQDLNFYRIPPRRWEAPDGPAPVEASVRKFREIMANPANYPVLVHCFAGVHRSGAFCAIYRMEFERWTNAEAIAELRACGYTTLDDDLDILGYLEQYRPAWRIEEEEAAGK